MKCAVKLANPDKQKSDCLVVGVYTKGRLTASAKLLDGLCHGLISKLLKREELKGEIGQTLLLQPCDQLPAERLLLVGLGDELTLRAMDYQKALNSAFSVIASLPIKRAHCYLADAAVASFDLAWQMKQGSLAASQACYQFTEFKSAPKMTLKEVIFSVQNRSELTLADAAIQEGLALSQGICLTKDLGNLPGNVCTPTYLADTAKKLAKQYKAIKCKILTENDMQKLGMHSLLSVSKGSREEAKLILLTYQKDAAKQQPVALIGKGITFDAGGISLKPARAMDEMKYDMCGAASVFGVFKAYAEMDQPGHFVGIIAASENLPDGQASKPGDIVKSLSGQTIEILNTDAEGRLVLCDALTYCQQQFKPAWMVDIATLTGAMVVALGNYYTGFFSNNNLLAKAIDNASQASQDPAWQMPMGDAYQELLQSPFADMANIGGPTAGSITAACFLSRYVKETPWAHLDIAGTAWQTGNNKSATGRPVALLTELLLQHQQQMENGA